MALSQKKVIALMGPTAVGKSRFAFECAKQFGAEVLNTDSLQVYKEYDIGSDKPPRWMRDEVPHHCFDLISPQERFSAGAYGRAADGVIAERPCGSFIAVGGCGLYLNALLYGLSPAPPNDEAVKAAIMARYDDRNDLMVEALKRVSPEEAAAIHPNDTFRIVRALCVYEMTGRSLRSFHALQAKQKPRYALLKIGLIDERDEIYRRIDSRIDRMIENGLLAEVEGLMGRGYGEELEPSRSIGYRYFYAWKLGRLDLGRAVELTKRDSRRYAKRQLTWFRKEKEISWFRPSELPEALRRLEEFLNSERAL